MIAIPNCPYCEKPLDGPTTNGLHEQCSIQLQEELDYLEHEMKMKKYSGVLNWRDSEGHTGTIGDFKDIEAPDRPRAEKVILDEFWDHRLDSACCAPVIVFAE